MIEINCNIFGISNQFGIVRNVNFDCTKTQKRVLICYLDYNDTSNKLLKKISHTNVLECMQIIKEFINFDFVIDIAFANNNKVQLSERYDYIFGFGSLFREAVQKNPQAIKIMYMTENPAEIAIPLEKERMKYFYQLTGLKRKTKRAGLYYRKGDVDLADYVITVGDIDFYRDKVCFSINPTGLYNSDFDLMQFSKKDAKSFLWLGSLGAIHKGLDILIEVFKHHPDWTLHVCGLNKLEKFEYKLNLKYPNIISHGFINIQSNDFLELVYKTVYTILPSCSEGKSTSILTCMRHGLIPIVTRNTGFNALSQYCYLLDNYRIEYVDKYLEQLISNNDMELLKRKTQLIYEFSSKNFTIDNYSLTLKNILNKIILGDTL